MYHAVRIGAIATLLLALLAPAGVFAESEPNDTIATADPIGIGYANAETNATLASDTDVDYYKFTTAANRTYVIETFNIAGTPDTYATGLWLYNAGGTQLDDDRYGSGGTGNANARIAFTFTNAGTYYIKVARAYSAWTGPYSLRVLPRYDQGGTWNASNDSEPNDTPELANTITIGLGGAVTRQLFDHSSFVTGDSDQDYYRFEAAANRTYVIETFNIAGTPDTYATGLWLYNASGTQIDDDRYGSQGTGNVNARVTFTPTTSGTYLVRVVRAYGPWTGSYSLRVLPRYDQPGAAWNASNDYEPNDIIELANELKVGLNNAVTRQLFNHSSFVTGDSDQDYYRFEAAANRTYVIETFNIAGTPDTYATGLWLYSAGGTSLDNDRYGSQGTGNVNARVTFTPTAAGTYFIRVVRAYGPWTGSYSLRVLPRYDQPGAAWNASNDYEPNDTIDLANELRVGPAGAQTHSIFAHANFVTGDSDQDYYRFNAVAGRPYIIQTFNALANASGYGTGIYLYSSGGTAIIDDRYGSKGTGNVDAQITYTFPNAGTYFIRVARGYNDWTGTYSIRVCQGSCTRSVYMPLVRR